MALNAKPSIGAGAYMTIAEVALMCRVTERTVRNWINDERLSADRMGGVIRISVEALRRFAKAAR